MARGICSSCNVTATWCLRQQPCELVWPASRGPRRQRQGKILEARHDEGMGVFPQMSASSPNIDGTCLRRHQQRRRREHIVIPAPTPSFIAVNKQTGEVAWDRSARRQYPARPVVQPAIGVIGGVKRSSSGRRRRLYATRRHRQGAVELPVQPEGRSTSWADGHAERTDRHAVIHDDRVFIAMGQIRHGEGPAHVRHRCHEAGDIAEGASGATTK